MKNKDDKQKDLEALRKDLESAKNLFVTGFEKLKVSQDFELRKTIRGVGGNYKVIKNNLAEKASQGTPAESLMLSTSSRSPSPPVKTTWQPISRKSRRATSAKLSGG